MAGHLNRLTKDAEAALVSVRRLNRELARREPTPGGTLPAGPLGAGAAGGLGPQILTELRQFRTDVLAGTPFMARLTGKS